MSVNHDNVTMNCDNGNKTNCQPASAVRPHQGRPPPGASSPTLNQTFTL